MRVLERLMKGGKDVAMRYVDENYLSQERNQMKMRRGSLVRYLQWQEIRSLVVLDVLV